jgi:hypothetical protein
MKKLPPSPPPTDASQIVDGKPFVSGVTIKDISENDPMKQHFTF